MSDKDLIAEAEKLVGEAKADGMSSVAYSVIKRLIAALEAATRERDAALAAIERVRAIHRPESNERYTWCVGCSTDEYPEDWPCPTVAALDGAPEPEEGP